MTIEFKLPLVSEGVESADIAAVHVKEGDVIEPGQVVFEVETEKAVAEIPCPQGGRVSKVAVSQGQTVKIGDLLLTLEESAAGEKPAASPTGSPNAGAPAEKASAAPKVGEKPPVATEPAAPAVKEAAPAKSSDPVRTAAPPTVVATRSRIEDNGHDKPVPAGPATRRLARELGVDLHSVSGSGPGGRITSEDVQSFVRTLTKGGAVSAPMNAIALPDFEKFGAVVRQPMNKLAKTAAVNLSYSWQNVPHVTQHELADVTDLEEARQSYMKSVGQNGPKITMTAIMVKAVVGALKAYPNFNSSLDLAAGQLLIKGYYHIGVAVDTEFGLLVPVIRDCDRKTVLTIARELSEIAQKARDRKVELSDMQGGTFTITNLGGIGGTAFTPIVNYPEVAILGMSRSQTQLKMIDGKVVERLMLPLSLSYDHRVVNGADAARFIAKLSRILSDFFQLLVEC